MTAVRVCARHRTPLSERGDALVCGACGEVSRWLVEDGSARQPLQGAREVLSSPAGPRRQHSAATKRRMAESQRKRRARERREATT